MATTTPQAVRANRIPEPEDAPVQEDNHHRELNNKRITAFMLAICTVILLTISAALACLIAYQIKYDQISGILLAFTVSVSILSLVTLLVTACLFWDYNSCRDNVQLGMLDYLKALDVDRQLRNLSDAQRVVLLSCYEAGFDVYKTAELLCLADDYRPDFYAQLPPTSELVKPHLGFGLSKEVVSAAFEQIAKEPSGCS